MRSCVLMLILTLPIASACENTRSKRYPPTNLNASNPDQTRKIRPSESSSGTSSIEAQSSLNSELPDLTPEQNPPTEEDAEIELGRAIFSSRCSSCHVLSPDLYKKMEASDILDHYAENFPTHRLVQWPDEREAYAIEKALR